MQIHIGNLIRDELRRQGHTNAWLMERIGVSERTLQRLFNKPSIDTQQLFLVSNALGTDLFRHYSDAIGTTPNTDTRQPLAPSILPDGATFAPQKSQTVKQPKTATQ